MSYEDFKNIAEGIQALLLGFGALMAGIWALFRFGITRERQRASLELERLQADARRLQGIQGELAVTHHKISDHKYYVQIDIVLENLGAYVRVLDTEEFPFVINRVTREATYGYAFEPIARLRIPQALETDKSPWRFPTTVVLFPRTPSRLSTFYELTDPGYYLFSLILSSPKIRAATDVDRNELNRAEDIFRSYASNPAFHEDDGKSRFRFEKFHLIEAAAAHEPARQPVAHQHSGPDR